MCTTCTTPAHKACLRIATLNVHGWHSGDGDETFSEITALVLAANVDVLALQEAPRHRVVPLAKALGGYEWISLNNLALLSRYPIRPADVHYGSSVAGGSSAVVRLVQLAKRKGAEPHPGPTRAAQPPMYRKSTSEHCDEHVSSVHGALGKVRHCLGRIEAPGGPLDVCCVHFSHIVETARQSQLRALVDGLAALPDIMLGDFNALTRADYTEGQWAEVAAVRAANAWEAPRTELTDALTGKPTKGRLPALGLVDARVAAASKLGPLSSCRFNTRIDYVYLKPELVRDRGVSICEHVVAIPQASDHNLVVATLGAGAGGMGPT